MEKVVVILFGSPGSGKTTVGAMLASSDSQRFEFFSLGEQFRAIRFSSSVDEKEIKATARASVIRKLKDFITNDSKPVLLLDCVKRVSDCESLTEICDHEEINIGAAIHFDCPRQECERRLMARDRPEENISHRLDTWDRTCNSITKYFHDNGLLVRVTCDSPLSEVLSSVEHIIHRVEGLLRSSTFLHRQSERKVVDSKMIQLLRFVHQPPCSTPATFATSSSLNWLHFPGRYFVTHKCDGVRFLLFCDGQSCYLRNRRGDLHACRTEPELSSDTILDGELIQSNGCFRFLAFDILCCGGSATLHLPFHRRLAKLQSVCSDIPKESPSAATAPDQTLPLIHVALKPYVPATETSLPDLMESNPHFPFDGVIFTPANLPYWPGPDELLYKWQPWDCLRLDVEFPSAHSLDIFESRRSLHLQMRQEALSIESLQNSSLDSDHFRKDWEGLLLKMVHTKSMSSWPTTILERISQRAPCEVVEFAPLSTEGWWPVRVRQDKAHGNRSRTIEQTLRAREKNMPRQSFKRQQPSIPYKMRQQSTFPHEMQQQHFVPHEMRSRPAVHQHIADLRICTAHALKEMAFKELYSSVMHEVEYKTVERTVDVDTGLEIFNYLPGGNDKCMYRLRFFNIIGLCRGLVLHAPTQTIVTRPFVRFPEEPGRRFTFPPGKDEDVMVEGTVKLDGSLVVVFLWNGNVMAVTRRRADSEQALWARSWLEKYVPDASHLLVAGWTYLFEAIYDDNRVVVEYPFESLVLLSAIDADGMEVDHVSREQIAERLGLMAVPTVVGRKSEFIKLVDQVDMKTLLTSEGWVLRFQDGTRVKLISSHWKTIWERASNINPIDLWRDMFRRASRGLQSSVSSSNVWADMPPHLAEECVAQVRCLKVLLEKLDNFATALEMDTTTEGEQQGKDEALRRLPWSRREFCRIGDDKSNESVQNLLTGFADLKLEDPQCHSIDESAIGDLERHGVDTIPSEKERGGPVVYKEDEYHQYFAALRSEYCFKAYMLLRQRHRHKRQEPELLKAALICIRPANQQLRGYQPSRCFRQTWCKGWGKKMIEVQRPSLGLPEELLIEIFSFCSASECARLKDVCCWWRDLISYIFDEKIRHEREEHEASFSRRFAIFDRDDFDDFDNHRSFSPPDWGRDDDDFDYFDDRRIGSP